MKFPSIRDVRVVLPRAALNEVFDECDRFPDDETGGRVIGTFEDAGGTLVLQISGIIEPGPGSRRSPVMLFQDGDYQERVFRRIEGSHPKVEHLGNWHTHHMNGLTHLSDGDVATYLRTVNHQQHNIPFFYAMLVVSKTRSRTPHERYSIKHYIARRGHKHVYEIPDQAVKVVDLPLIWPEASSERPASNVERVRDESGNKQRRVLDNATLCELYPGLRPYSSKKIGVYWRGTLDLIDGSTTEVLLVEDSGSPDVTYSVYLREPTKPLEAVADALKDRRFPTAAAAVSILERGCNRALWEQVDGQH